MVKRELSAAPLYPLIIGHFPQARQDLSWLLTLLRSPYQDRCFSFKWLHAVVCIWLIREGRLREKYALLWLFTSLITIALAVSVGNTIYHSSSRCNRLIFHNKMGSLEKFVGRF
jgi:hypothetical protein